MRTGCAADHSPPSSAAIMEEWSYTSTHPLGHAGPVTGTLYFTFYLNHHCYEKKRKLSLNEQLCCHIGTKFMLWTIMERD